MRSRIEGDGATRSVANRLALAVLGALATAWALSSLSWPFGWDQGIFATVGDVVVRGGMPYRDGWDNKGPLTYYGYALAQALCGRVTWGVRLLDLVLLAAGGLAMLRVVAHVAEANVARWASLVYVLLVASHGWWNTAQPDGWVAIAMLVAVATTLPRGAEASPLRYLIAGALIGSAALVKPVYAAFALVPLSQLLALRESPARLARRGAAVILGLGGAVGLCAAWFAYRGALADLFDVYVLFNATVHSRIAGAGVPATGRLAGLAELLAGSPVGVGLPAIAVGIHAAWRGRRTAAVVLLAWAGSALLCVAAQNRFYGYHWLPVYPPLVVLGALGLRHLLDHRTWASASAPQAARAARVVGVACAAAVLFQVAVEPATSVWKAWQAASGRWSPERYHASFYTGPRPTFTAAHEMAAARFVRERTTEGDPILVWGWNASIYYLSGRRPATRFLFSAPLLAAPGSELATRYRRELLADLTADLPPYLIVGAPYADRTGVTSLRSFPELRAVVHACYRLETRVGRIAIHRATAGSERCSRALAGSAGDSGARRPGPRAGRRPAQRRPAQRQRPLHPTSAAPAAAATATPTGTAGGP